MRLAPKTYDALVLAANTPTPLSEDEKPITSVIIYADPTNTGNVYYGDEDVDSTNGVPIAPDGSLEVDCDRFSYMEGYEIDLTELYVVTGTTGNRVRINTLERKP